MTTPDPATALAEVAADLLRPTTSYYNGGQTRSTDGPPPDAIAEAQVRATLALVEEQRTANLIARAALAAQMHANDFAPVGDLYSAIVTVDGRLGL